MDYSVKELKLLTRVVVVPFCLVFFVIFLADSNPILIFLNVPEARVTIDGNPVTFFNRCYQLNGWHYSYLIEVHGPFPTQRRRIFPWSSDSGSISIEKDGAHFFVANAPAD